VEVRAGETVSCLLIPPGNCILHGRITCAGSILEDIVLSVRPVNQHAEDSAVALGFFAGLGEFTIAEMSPGLWSISASVSGVEDKVVWACTTQVNVKCFDDALVELILQPR
jgi:hypothetical protein